MKHQVLPFCSFCWISTNILRAQLLNVWHNVFSLGIIPPEVLSKVVVQESIFMDMVKHGRRTVLNSVPSIVKTRHTSLWLFLGEKKIWIVPEKINWNLKYFTGKNVGRAWDFYMQCVDHDFLFYASSWLATVAILKSFFLSSSWQNFTILLMQLYIQGPVSQPHNAFSFK